MITGNSGQAVWGTTIYTDGSDTAAAAVHAGVVENTQTKTVRIKILPGQLSY